jgi:16S rRNA processing protein RimM
VERKIEVLGYVAAAHGINGWVRILSLTETPDAIFGYQPWLLGETLQQIRHRQGQKHGNKLLAQLEGAEHRGQAEALVHRQIAVYRDQFPALSAGEYYWTDLLGLSVRLEDGRELGEIENMLATGANDVMVVRGERDRLIPFVPGRYVKRVDLDARTVIVDWDPDF